MSAAKDLIRIGIDARCLNCNHLRGAGKYLWEILSRLGGEPGLEWQLFADRPDLPLHRPRNDLDVQTFEWRGYRFHSWEQLALPRRARRLGLDLLHCPSMSLPWWQPIPTLVTLHDAMPWLLGDASWPPSWYRDRLLPRAFRKCAALITDSESSRRDIVALWPGLGSKLHVIPLGVGDGYLQAIPGQLGDAALAHGVRQPYLLYLGGEIPRKRLTWALQVLEALQAPDLSLVVCGVDRECHATVRNLIRPELRSQICLLPFINEAALPALYANAVAVLYPTLYEGFGLPVVEAQAVGTPVLFSALGSLAELQGPGAVVLPPYELDAWVSACRKCLARWRSDGQPNVESRGWARQFSWDAAAARHLQVYRQVAAAGRQRWPRPAKRLPSRFPAPTAAIRGSAAGP
jgi:alpha-1,3-rhamnosyl/mannosyltransferase